MAGFYEERTEEPGGRDPAPGGLRTVQMFVNSRDIENDLDLFDGLVVASRWLFDKGLTTELGTVRTDADLQRILALREAVRGLLASDHDHTSPLSRHGGVLGTVAAAGDLSVAVDDTGEVRVVATADGLDGALARIVLIVAAASATGQWQRFKVCSNDVCQWAFWDNSRNRSGRWCTMSVCGNQAKVRAHRQRAAE